MYNNWEWTFRMGEPGRSCRIRCFRLWLLPVLVLGFLSAQCAWATTYYVGPNGSNSLSTNAAAPGMLTYAITNAPASSTVILEDGVYNGAATGGYNVTRSGVTFRAQHWHKAIIKNSAGSNLWGPTAQSVVNDVCQGIVFGPCALPAAGGWSGGGGDGWQFLDCVFTQNGGVGFGNNSLVLHCLFTDQWANSFDVNGVTGFTMKNSIARRGNRANGDSDSVGDKCDFATNLTFDGLIAYDNEGPALWFDTHNTNWAVRNCTFFANHGGGNWFTLGISGGTSANQFTGNGQDGEGLEVGASLIAISGTAANLHHTTTITAVHGYNPQIFTVSPPLPVAPNRDDIFAAQHPHGLADGCGLISEANQGPGLAENNVFYSNTDNGLEDNDSGSKAAITIRNNWFVDNHARAIQFRGMADMGSNYNNVDRKRGVNLINDVTKVGNGGNYGSGAANDRTVSWSGGTPTPEVSSDHGYIWQNAVSGDQGWSFSAPADTATRTVSIYAGGYSAQVTLTAHVSDSSASDYTLTKTYHGGGLDLYTIAYRAGSPGQKLTVSYIKSATADGHSDGSADLVAGWLTAGGDAGKGITGSVAPPAASYNLSAVGALDWIHWGRVSYSGADRQLGVALVTDNVFKGSAPAWGTVNEQHVLAVPADMGSVIDHNIYDIASSYHGPWALWKPTDARAPVAVTGIAEMRSRLRIEAHGRAQHVDFRGTLVPTVVWPPDGDTNWSEIYYPGNIYSPHGGIRQVDDDETPYIQNAVSHAAVGSKVVLKVFGHTPFQGAGPYTCEVYDYSGCWIQLTMKRKADRDALDARVPPYAVLTPTSLSVTLTSGGPYNLAAMYSSRP
jgi:hypothetical protein